MLSVLLNILSIIGMILLVILGLVVFILLIVLFVPITYKVKGNADKQNQEVHVRVNWLWGIVRFRLQYLKQLQWNIRILWIDPLKPKKTKVSKKRPDASESSTSAGSMSDSSSSVISADPAAEESINITVSQPVNAEQEQTASQDDSVPVQEKKSLKEKITNIIDKVKNIYSTIDYYIKVLQDIETKTLIKKCFKVLGNILKHIRPRKLKIKGTMGFDSPDKTGKVYGYLCMLYPFYGNNICITPDFENNILEGDLYCRGRIYLCVPVWNALKILLDRKLYKLIHKLKNGGKLKNGR